VPSSARVLLTSCKDLGCPGGRRLRQYFFYRSHTGFHFLLVRNRSLNLFHVTFQFIDLQTYSYIIIYFIPHPSRENNNDCGTEQSRWSSAAFPTNLCPRTSYKRANMVRLLQMSITTLVNSISLSARHRAVSRVVSWEPCFVSVRFKSTCDTRLWIMSILVRDGPITSAYRAILAAAVVSSQVRWESNFVHRAVCVQKLSSVRDLPLRPHRMWFVKLISSDWMKTMSDWFGAPIVSFTVAAFWAVSRPWRIVKQTICWPELLTLFLM